MRELIGHEGASQESECNLDIHGRKICTQRYLVAGLLFMPSRLRQGTRICGIGRNRTQSRPRPWLLEYRNISRPVADLAVHA